MTVRRVVVTPGMGIGPEITLKAVARAGATDLVLVGRWAALEAANEGLGLWLSPVNAVGARSDGGIPVVDPGEADEPTEVAAIRVAARACLAGEAAAMVTGPIHKGQLAAQGFAFRGHTDFLGHLCGGGQPVMAFAGGRLRVALVTTHLPLAEVSAQIDADRVRHVVETAARALKDDLGIEVPRLAVCGLNPHAGENGLLGHEEQEVIGPVCEALRSEGWTLRGPRSSEVVFREALSGEYDLVVAMYHDQGLAPLKLVDFGRSVNWTLGLPLVRTSVDHGTADDIAGTGQANPASMLAALALAREIVARRAAL